MSPNHIKHLLPYLPGVLRTEVTGSMCLNPSDWRGEEGGRGVCPWVTGQSKYGKMHTDLLFIGREKYPYLGCANLQVAWRYFMYLYTCTFMYVSRMGYK